MDNPTPQTLEPEVVQNKSFFRKNAYLIIFVFVAIIAGAGLVAAIYVFQEESEKVAEQIDFKSERKVTLGVCNQMVTTDRPLYEVNECYKNCGNPVT